MKKQCIQCGHLNDTHAVTCAECSSDLLQAQEVFEQAIQDPDASSDWGKTSDTDSRRGPTTGSTDRVTEQLPCDCPIPGGDPGATCFACGGTVLSKEQAAAPCDSYDDYDAPHAFFANAAAVPRISIRFPNAMRKEIGEGIFLGRDVAQAGAETATALGTLMGISRSHAWLCCSGNGVIVVDLGSRNGTWLGSERLQPWKSRFIDATDLPVEIRLGARGLIQIMAENPK